MESLVKLVLSPKGTEGGTELTLLDRLRTVVPEADLVVAPDRESCLREIVDADAFYGTMTPDVLAVARCLRWIQSPNIGQENYMFPALESHPVVMTNSAGIYSDDIAGAGLDVFEPEPLPADHPLWEMENVIIMPHVAGAGPHSVERLHAILLENLRRFVKGEPLMNVIDKARWY